MSRTLRELTRDVPLEELAQRLALFFAELPLTELPATIARLEPPPAPPPAPLDLASVERRAIDAVLQMTGGNRVHAARILGVDRVTLHRKLGPRRASF